MAGSAPTAGSSGKRKRGRTASPDKGKQPVRSKSRVAASPAVDNVDYFLAELDETTLNRFLKRDLEELCERRGLSVAGNKPTLVKQLIEWVVLRGILCPV